MCRRDPYQPMRKCISIRQKLKRLMTLAPAQRKGATAKVIEPHARICRTWSMTAALLNTVSLPLRRNAIAETRPRFASILQQTASSQAPPRSMLRYAQMSAPTWLSPFTTTACSPELKAFFTTKSSTVSLKLPSESDCRLSCIPRAAADARVIPTSK